MSTWRQWGRETWNDFKTELRAAFRDSMQNYRTGNFAHTPGTWISQTRLESVAMTGVALLLLVAILPQPSIAFFTHVALLLLVVAIPVLVMVILMAQPAHERAGDSVMGQLIFAEAVGSGLVVLAMGFLVLQLSFLGCVFFLFSIVTCVAFYASIRARLRRDEAQESSPPVSSPPAPEESLTETPPHPTF
jgi:hypothetical protein